MLEVITSRHTSSAASTVAQISNAGSDGKVATLHVACCAALLMPCSQAACAAAAAVPKATRSLPPPSPASQSFDSITSSAASTVVQLANAAASGEVAMAAAAATDAEPRTPALLLEMVAAGLRPSSYSFTSAITEVSAAQALLLCSIVWALFVEKMCMAK